MLNCCEKHRLLLNVFKTQLISFSAACGEELFTFKVDTDSVNVIRNNTFLRITVDSLIGLVIQKELNKYFYGVYKICKRHDRQRRSKGYIFQPHLVTTYIWTYFLGSFSNVVNSFVMKKRVIREALRKTSCRPLFVQL